MCSKWFKKLVEPLRAHAEHISLDETPSLLTSLLIIDHRPRLADLIPLFPPHAPRPLKGLHPPITDHPHQTTSVLPPSHAVHTQRTATAHCCCWRAEPSVRRRSEAIQCTGHFHRQETRIRNGVKVSS